MVPRFQPLRVVAVRRLTEGAVVLTLEAPASFRAFQPGQYLTVQATIAGRDVRRIYSLCSGPDETHLQIGVRRLSGGVFSTWACAMARAGDTVLAMPPDGRFGVTILPAANRVFAAFVAGSGITPVLSILRTLLAREPGSRFWLFYGNRTTADIMFREEIEDLKDRYVSRLSVFHVLSRERQELEILNGRLDAGKVAALTRLMPVPDHVLICGPHAMIEGLEPALAAAEFPPGRIRVERFTPALDAGRAMETVAPVMDVAPAAVATLILDGTRIAIPVARGETILAAALRAGRDPPFSCRAGMCCTCRARLLDGRVAMAANYSLEPWETAAGYVLTCQAVPLTDQVVVDFDQV